MSDNNNELESLSRLREIIFGEQLTKLEEEIKNLSSENRVSFERLSNELKQLLEEKEESFNKLLNEQKEAFDKQFQQLADSKADSKKLAEALRNIADSFDNKD